MNRTIMSTIQGLKNLIYVLFILNEAYYITNIEVNTTIKMK